MGRWPSAQASASHAYARVRGLHPYMSPHARIYQYIRRTAPVPPSYSINVCSLLPQEHGCFCGAPDTQTFSCSVVPVRSAPVLRCSVYRSGSCPPTSTLSQSTHSVRYRSHRVQYAHSPYSVRTRPLICTDVHSVPVLMCSVYRSGSCPPTSALSQSTRSVRTVRTVLSTHAPRAPCAPVRPSVPIYTLATACSPPEAPASIKMHLGGVGQLPRASTQSVRSLRLRRRARPHPNASRGDRRRCARYPPNASGARNDVTDASRDTSPFASAHASHPSPEVFLLHSENRILISSWPLGRECHPPFMRTMDWIVCTSRWRTRSCTDLSLKRAAPPPASP